MRCSECGLDISQELLEKGKTKFLTIKGKESRLVETKIRMEERTATLVEYMFCSVPCLKKFVARTDRL